MPFPHDAYPVKRPRLASASSSISHVMPETISSYSSPAGMAASRSPSRPEPSARTSAAGKRKVSEAILDESQENILVQSRASAPSPENLPSSGSDDGHGGGSSSLFGPHCRTLRRTLRAGGVVETEEYLRLTLQTLRGLGLHTAAATLEAESGVQEEPTSITHLRTLILSGHWRRATRTLKQLLTDYCDRSETHFPRSSRRTNGSVIAGSLSYPHKLSAAVLPPTCPSPPLRDDVQIPNQAPYAPAMRNSTKGWNHIKQLIYQQWYLESVETGDTKQALYVLRTYMMPLLGNDHEQVQWWSALVLCSTPEELQDKAHTWKGAGHASREWLLKQIEDSLVPAIMLPSNRMNVLLEQALEYQRTCLPKRSFLGDGHVLSLCVDGDDYRHELPDCCLQILHTASTEESTGESWTVAFSFDGSWLACAGSNRKVALFLLRNAQYCFIGHLGLYNTPVSSLAWSPDSHSLLVGCGPSVFLYDLPIDDKCNFLAKALSPAHNASVSAVVWLPSGNGFITGGHDDKLMFWDRDGRHLASWFITPFHVLGMDVSPDGTRLVVASFSHTSPNDRTSIQPLDQAHKPTIFPCPMLPSGLPLCAGADISRTSSPEEAVTEAIFALSDECNQVDYGLGNSSTQETSSRSDQCSGYLSTSPPRTHGASSTYENRPYVLHVFDLTRNVEQERLFLQDELYAISFASDSRHILTSHRDDAARLWDLGSPGSMLSISLSALYRGHTCTHHQVTGCFGGVNEPFILVGSQDARAHIYHRTSGRHLGALVGHRSGTVNCVVRHPTAPSLYATGGDDGTVRLWAPGNANPLAEAWTHASPDASAVARKITTALPARSNSRPTPSPMALRRYNPAFRAPSPVFRAHSPPMADYGSAIVPNPRYFFMADWERGHTSSDAEDRTDFPW